MSYSLLSEEQTELPDSNKKKFIFQIEKSSMKSKNVVVIIELRCILIFWLKNEIEQLSHHYVLGILFFLFVNVTDVTTYAPE